MKTTHKPYQLIFSRLIGSVLATVVIFGLTMPTASASVTGGLRGGITDDPDTGFMGGHLAIYPKGIPLRIEPSLELGFGDFGRHADFITLRITGNFKYMFRPGRSHSLYLYPILGISMYYFDWDDCDPHYDCSDTEMGVNLGFGLQYSGFMFDLTFGAGGEPYPDIIFAFGYTF